MKPEQLIPLNQISHEKMRKLFDENFNFAWNVRHHVEENEAFWFQEMFKEFGSAKIEWEMGLYTKCKFSVHHETNSLREFTIGCFKILKDYNLFNSEDANYIDALGIAEQAYENCEPEKEDEILGKAYVLMDAVANLIEGHLRECFAYWESDEHVFEEISPDYKQIMLDHDNTTDTIPSVDFKAELDKIIAEHNRTEFVDLASI